MTRYRSGDEYGEKGGAREKARKRLVSLVFLFYLLMIAEGALRKWFFPGLNKYLYFIKDPVVLMMYVIAFKHKLWPSRTKIFRYAKFLMVFGVLYIGVQYISQYPRNTVLSLVYGWRMYFFYVPMAFLIGANFRGRDLRRIIGLTLLIALPMSAVCYKQATSPPTAFINRVGGSGEGYVTLAGFTSGGQSAGGTVVRTTGTFTYFHGWQVFLGSLIASCFIAWVLPAGDRPIHRRWLLGLATVAVGIAYSTDVTRTPTFLAAFICLTTGYASFKVRDASTRKRARMALLVLIALGMTLSLRYFYGQHQARQSRMDEDYLETRTSNMFTNFMHEFKRYPFLGGGLGANTPGGKALGATQNFRWPPPLDWVRYTDEDEWSSMFAEAGMLLGSLYMFFRVWMVIWLFRNASTAVRKSSNPTPLILWGFISSIILVWYITKIGSVNSAGWLYAGLCMASTRLGEDGIWSDRRDILKITAETKNNTEKS
ncbi:MAG: hypothetical protein GF392_05175 [Candidatus Omnitrophica bacterium]|nr:hypothetical protein [Candidatus Omnitrophota bacterium]